MSLEVRFPFEFLVEGVPVALGASSRSRDRWKAQVVSVARAQLPEGHWATREPVAVTIFYFPAGRMQGDVDNIVKPILDALCSLLYMDDIQVERVWVQKFEPHRPYVISNPTPCLAEALDRPRPVVYVRIDDDVSLEVQIGGQI